jgi:excisionase family DNA binding protein
MADEGARIVSPLAEMPAVLTVEEAAKVLRIGRSAAYEGVRVGQIPSLKVGRSIRVPKHQLERLLGITNDDEPAGNGLEVTATPMQAADHEV